MNTSHHKIRASILLLLLVIGSACHKISTEEQVHQLMTERMITLATAESCTGGAIATRFTAMPGASAYFLCGLVTYSNDSKCSLLDVSADSIDRYGIVSESVARQMAEGARGRLHADYTISTTGFAGPTGGTPEAPLGTVWIAVATPTRTVCKSIHVDKNRQSVIREASDEAIRMLLNELNNE